MFKKANEDTPLSGSPPLSSPSSGGLEAISNLAQTVFTQENLENVGRAAKDQALELKAQAEEGDSSLRILALLGGIASIVVAIFEIFREISHLNIIGALIEIYTLLIGIVVVILEGKNMVLSVGAVHRIHKYALFLKFLWGRGCLYFICGTLMIYQIDLFNLIVGAYMCGVGILFVFVGQRTAYKLRSLRKSLYSENTLRQKFRMAAIDGDDSLNVQQFRTLCMQLGLDLNRRETEAAFYHIHKSETEKMTFQEFHVWWAETDANGELEENAFVFV